MTEGYEVREGYLYTRDHEWVKIEGKVITVGITDYGQSKLRDIVHVELPDIGETVGEGEVIATIESIKAVSEIYSPAAGRIIDVNVKLTDNPELINEDPYEKGWIVKIELVEERSFGDLMEADEYQKYLEDLEEAV